MGGRGGRMLNGCRRQKEREGKHVGERWVAMVAAWSLPPRSSWYSDPEDTDPPGPHGELGQWRDWVWVHTSDMRVSASTRRRFRRQSQLQIFYSGTSPTLVVDRDPVSHAHTLPPPFLLLREHPGRGLKELAGESRLPSETRYWEATEHMVQGRFLSHKAQVQNLACLLQDIWFRAYYLDTLYLCFLSFLGYKMEMMTVPAWEGCCED